MTRATSARKAVDAVLREMRLAPELVAARRLGPVATGHGQRVLFLTPRSWAAHVQWDAVLGRALAARGADVSYLTCGGGRQICDRVHTYEGPPMPCHGCAGYTHAALTAHGHRWKPLHGDGAPAPTAEPDWPELDALTVDELVHAEHRGVPLGELVRVPVGWFLCSTALHDDPLAPNTFRRFLRAAAAVADEIEAALDRERPEIVVMLNGMFLFEQVARFLCDRRGLDVVTYERGYAKGTVFFHRDAPASRYETGDLWDAQRDRALTPEEDAELDRYLDGRRIGKGMINSFWPAPRFHEPEPGFAVLFTNVTWDTAVQGRERCFADARTWVVETIQWFATHPEHRLVVRAHPAEVHSFKAQSREPVVDVIDRAFPRLPANVRVIGPDDPTSSYPLMEAADLALVYTSTAGMEAALLGTPCVTAAATQFGSKGFTLDPPDSEAYFEQLEAVLTDPATVAVDVELARRYAHFFFFKAALRSDRWMWEPISGLARITGDRSMLEPGGDPDLDVICAGILERRPFLRAV